MSEAWDLEAAVTVTVAAAMAKVAAAMAMAAVAKEQHMGCCKDILHTCFLHPGLMVVAHKR